jgi:hypothetical protein
MNVWHYTAWSRLSDIVDSGELRPSNTGAPGEHPLLWFSANQNWEPTATKMIFDSSGRVRQLSFQQQAELLGCIRLGIPVDDARLLEWKEACNAAGTPRSVRRALESAGRKRGGNPVHWFGSLVSMPITDLRLQAWTDGAWHSGDPSGMATLWKTSAVK